MECEVEGKCAVDGGNCRGVDKEWIVTAGVSAHVFVVTPSSFTSQ